VALRTRYGLNARVAMRVAHGWTQAEAAQRCQVEDLE
jgi:hypothetical protein